MAVPKRFRFKKKKQTFKSINNNQTYVLSLRNKQLDKYFKDDKIYSRRIFI